MPDFTGSVFKYAKKGHVKTFYRIMALKLLIDLLKYKMIHTRNIRMIKYT